MEKYNLNDIAMDVFAKSLLKHSEVIGVEIVEEIKKSMKEDMYVSEDVSKLVGYAAAASATAAVKLSTITLIEVLAQLDLIEHDGHPYLRLVKDENATDRTL